MASEYNNCPTCDCGASDCAFCQFAAVTAERDLVQDVYGAKVKQIEAENARLRAAIEPTRELTDALVAAGLGKMPMADVRAFLAAIAARAGVKL